MTLEDGERTVVGWRELFALSEHCDTSSSVRERVCRRSYRAWSSQMGLSSRIGTYA